MLRLLLLLRFWRYTTTPMQTPLQGGMADRRLRKLSSSRPSVAQGSTKENWNTFLARLEKFKRGTRMAVGEAIQQLFQCCEGDLGDNILRSNPDATRGTEDELLAAIKRLSVIPVAKSVRRSNLLAVKQDHSENVRSFYARINGNKLSQQHMSTTSWLHWYDCKRCFDIRTLRWRHKEGCAWLVWTRYQKSEGYCVVHRQKKWHETQWRNRSLMWVSQRTTKIKCKNCKTEIDNYTWNKRLSLSLSLCLPCWKRANPQRGKKGSGANEASVIAIASTSNTQTKQNRTITLNHHIFTKEGWRQADSMKHPTLKLELTVIKEDYDKFKVGCPQVAPSPITVLW